MTTKHKSKTKPKPYCRICKLYPNEEPAEMCVAGWLLNKGAPMPCEGMDFKAGKRLAG